jgi:predicted nucleic acid-binding protein
MTGFVYDTGALVAAERDDRRFWLLHGRALARGRAPLVPTPVLAEAWRGRTAMARLLSGCRVEPLDAPRARAAGLLLGSCAKPVGATDAVVVEAALRRGHAVVTSDRHDIEALAAGVNRRVDVIVV